MNEIKTWQQGHFIDKPQYSDWLKCHKENAEIRENKIVRPSPEENAICTCATDADAKWIASRLNLASELEQLTYDFVMGRKFETDLFEFVKNKIDL